MNYKNKYLCKENDNFIAAEFNDWDVGAEGYLEELHFGTEGIDGATVIGILDLEVALDQFGYRLEKKEI